MISTLLENFWSQSFWLPPNITWAHLEPGAREDVVFTNYRHLLIPIPLSLVILFIRYCVEK